MSTQELDLYISLLKDYYGEEYISDFEVLRELLEVDFDIKTTVAELATLVQMQYDTEDLQKCLSNCGINY